MNMPYGPQTFGAASSLAGARRKVMLIQTQAENAGAQEISRILAGGLARRGYDVRQLFFFRRTDAFDADPTAAFCMPRRPSDPLSLLRFLYRLHAEIRAFRPDVVLCFQHYGNLIGAPVARLAGATRIVANQNSATLTAPARARHADRWLGRLGAFTRIVVHSQDSEAEYAAYPRRYRERLVRIDHGFEGKASRLGKPEARAKFGLPADGPVLGCVARLHQLKHLDAAIRLVAREPGWSLALAGQGPARAELVALAASLGCADRLHLVGELPRAEVGDFLAALDVFVFPSQAETFGLAVVEAAQAGVPTVANDIPVLREVLAVDGSRCALLVDVDKVEAFAGAVRTLLTNTELARTLSERARGLAQRFPLDGMVDAYEALITECLASAPRP
jgi:glycosyltransferase involved in cell wall biosynthesis